MMEKSYAWFLPTIPPTQRIYYIKFIDMKMDPIGIFRGKGISTMTRNELFEFAVWASGEIQRLEIHLEAAKEDPPLTR